MEELVESILDYIRSDYTDYAIMINGEWGSGKTYFWNNKIRKQIDSLRLMKNITVLSYIYSATITITFSFIVNCIIHFVLKKIDMIESLKSVE